MKKKVLVTGAGGYIGRYVVKILLMHGYDVIAADIRTELVPAGARMMPVDIFSGSKDIYRELNSPEICIHLAWQDGFVHNSESHIRNLYPHYLFIKNMLEGGVRQIAIMGTMHEIGYWEGPVDANTPCNPSTLYGIAKNALRQMIEPMALVYKDVSFKWLRAFYIYGDDDRNHSVFTKILEAAKKGAETFPLVTGVKKYDFISVEELAEQIAATSVQDEYVGIINCCSGEAVSLKSKVEAFIVEQGLGIRPIFGEYPERETDSPEIWGNNEIIRLIMPKWRNENGACQ